MQNIYEGTIGSCLQQMRKAQGLSLSALATRSGVHKATLSRWEKNTFTPRVPELNSVLNTLTVSAKIRAQCHEMLLAPRAMAWAKQHGTETLGVGDLLRALRLRAGYSQTEAARRAGMGQTLLTKWEIGQVLPSGATLHALCYALGASATEAAHLTLQSATYHEPVADDRDAVLTALGELLWGSVSPQKDLAFLSLASQMGRLQKKGRAELYDVAAVWARHGEWAGQFADRRNLAETLAGRAFSVVQKSNFPVSAHLFSAVAMQYALHEDAAARETTLPTLLSLQARVAHTPVLLGWLQAITAKEMLATAPCEAVNSAHKSVQTVADGGATNETFFRQIDLCRILLQLDRLDEAGAVLQSITLPDTAPFYRASLRLLTAEVAAKQADKSGAIAALTDAETVIETHGLHTYQSLASDVAQLLEA